MKKQRAKTKLVINEEFIFDQVKNIQGLNNPFNVIANLKGNYFNELR